MSDSRNVFRDYHALHTNAPGDIELRLRNTNGLEVESFLNTFTTDIILFLAIRWS